jgi:hypothetical protein
MLFIETVEVGQEVTQLFPYKLVFEEDRHDVQFVIEIEQLEQFNEQAVQTIPFELDNDIPVVHEVKQALPCKEYEFMQLVQLVATEEQVEHGLVHDRQAVPEIK